MPVPSLNAQGLLPEGIHDCTWVELLRTFCQFQTSDRRPELCRRLREMMDALRQAKTARDLLVNGSFVTSKAVPNDIDLILVEYVDLFKRVRYEAHQRKGILRIAL